MPPETDESIAAIRNEADHMIERFYRSDEVRSYQGTGLGTRIRIVISQ